ncbi:uncharacterized protein LOC123550207 [Mercenaria mercenaria]|uniref:uncharacterized protein LOC123550207 n=1 Tax=Mercenaria mercenaria TaxID=6596 RepID=UPI001E1E0364|nr:uncharacterized protein LOC123550207 [Mercenaria mercenaria]
MKIVLLFVLMAFSGVTEAIFYFFYEYSCPLRSSGSSLSSSNNKDCASSKRDVHHGWSHTYIQIGSMCYDWGNWNYPRHLPCDDEQLACCVREKSLARPGTSRCVDRVGEFEAAWTRDGISYDGLFWNCQRFTTLLYKFLTECPATPATTYAIG